LYDKAFVAQQGIDSASKPYVPVTGNSIEAGIKKDWFNGRWNSTVSAYNITRNNVVTYIPGPEFKNIQTGQTKAKGIEADIRGEIARGLNVVLNYAFTDAKVTKDEDASKIGNPVQTSGFAKHITNGWFTYRIQSGKIKGFGVSAGYQYQAGRTDELPDYFRLDGNISWQGSQFSIALNANNILNDYLFIGSRYDFDSNPATKEYYFQVEPGINFRLTCAYKF
jgi:iron complex outermembrane receptor protein